MRRTKKAVILIPMILLLGATACAGQPEAGTQAAATSAKETAKVDILLTAAPKIELTDSLSSTINHFEVQSRSYSWSYLDGRETVSIAACGSHPLDINGEKAEKLTVPRYNQMDAAPYSVSAVVAPDHITVREWDISQLGKTEAAADSSTDYEGTSFISLKPDRVYEIVAVWDQEQLEDNGFCGEASYAVITE